MAAWPSDKCADRSGNYGVHARWGRRLPPPRARPASAGSPPVSAGRLSSPPGSAAQQTRFARCRRSQPRPSGRLGDSGRTGLSRPLPFPTDSARPAQQPPAPSAVPLLPAGAAVTVPKPEDPRDVLRLLRQVITDGRRAALADWRTTGEPPSIRTRHAETVSRWRIPWEAARRLGTGWLHPIGTTVGWWERGRNWGHVSRAGVMRLTASNVLAGVSRRDLGA
jgi:hypothetical protein